MVKKKTSKKRRKIKKKIILISILICLIITCIIPIYIIENKQNNKEQSNNNSSQTNLTQKKEELISNILSYNIEETINTKFLEWIDKEFSIDVLKKMNDHLDTSEYNSNIWHQLTGYSFIVLKDKYNNISSNRIKELTPKSSTTEVTLSFVGDVSLADDWYIMPKYDERNKKVYGILSEEVVDIMTSSDITVANNEFTISNRGSKMPNKYYTFRGSPERLSIYKEMGVNLVTLANNHIYDYGTDAFNDALDALEQYDIPYIGAGRNIEEAKQPYYYIINGYKIGFVNATRAEKYILTPEATETTGGVLRCYDPTTFIEVIQETKKNSDFVITLVHWGKEDSSELEKVQLDTSKQYIEAGADVIVGTHAHTLQGIDFYQNKAIIYNIGDFIFNHETKDTGIFQLKIDENGSLTYYFKPCKQEEKYTYLLTGEEQIRVLNKMRALSPSITIENDGKFYYSNNTSTQN